MIKNLTEKSVWASDDNNVFTYGIMQGVGVVDSPTFANVTITNDLFFNAGSIIDFDDGNVTITHSASLLTLIGGLTLSGLLNANGGIAVDTDKFTVADGTGITTIAGLLNANGGIAVDTNKFTVADGSGDTLCAGTLGVTGLSALNGGIKTGASDVGIKWIKITGTTHISEGGALAYPHGLTTSKIIGITGFVSLASGDQVGPGYTAGGMYWEYGLEDDNILIKNHATDSENILNKAFKLIVLYEV
jgi:hypothetical protein